MDNRRWRQDESSTGSFATDFGREICRKALDNICFKRDNGAKGLAQKIYLRKLDTDQISKGILTWS
jgi:hypothetical protein